MKPNWIGGTGSGLGSFFGVGCPACVPAIGAVFSALGIGFLVNFTLLKWLTLVLLTIGVMGLYANSRKHGKKIFLIIGVIASGIVFSSRYIQDSTPALYTGAGILLANAVVDFIKTKKNKICCDTPVKKKK